MHSHEGPFQAAYMKAPQMTPQASFTPMDLGRERANQKELGLGVFIVAEKIEGTACRIIPGPSASQKSVVPVTNDVLTFTTSKRTKGMLSNLFY